MNDDLRNGSLKKMGDSQKKKKQSPAKNKFRARVHEGSIDMCSFTSHAGSVCPREGYL